MKDPSFLNENCAISLARGKKQLGRVKLAGGEEERKIKTLV